MKIFSLVENLYAVEMELHNIMKISALLHFYYSFINKVYVNSLHTQNTYIHYIEMLRLGELYVYLSHKDIYYYDVTL